MKYGPYICFGVVIFILFIIWLFFGGKKYDFVGLAPLAPDTFNLYQGSVYNWGKEQKRNIKHDDEGNNENVICENKDTGGNGGKEQKRNIKNDDEGNNENVICENKDNGGKDDGKVICENKDNGGKDDGKVICENKDVDIKINKDNKDISIYVNINSNKISVDNTPNIPNVNLEKNDICIVDDNIKPVNIKRGRFISKGEKICCETMENIYGLPFKSIRPKFLQNPETGYNLELDCYNDELKLAVEYNGEQHYKWPNFTNQTYEQFIKQTRRATLKRQLCDKNEVYLIVVPYNITHEKIPEYIISYLPESLQKRLQQENNITYSNI